MSADITRDDLRILLRRHEHDGMWHEHTRRVFDEEFDRLARQWVRDNPASAIEEAFGESLTWVTEEERKERTSLLRVLLTDECDECAGYGETPLPPWGANANKMMPCPNCAGRGWLPKDGAPVWWCDVARTAKPLTEQMARCDTYGEPTNTHSTCGERLVVNLDWLEAEDG